MILLVLLLCIFPRPNLGACGVASVSSVSGESAPSGPFCVGDVLFEENFDTFDLEVWDHENTIAGGGNWEFQWYLNNRSNSYVENGTLKIKPTLLSDDRGEDFLYTGQLDVNGNFPTDDCTNAAFYGCSRTGGGDSIVNPIKSARIRTVYSFSFQYGRLEARVKVPTGDWLWPAVWLLPTNNVYGGWPASGEIDLLEVRGNKNLTDKVKGQIGTQLLANTLHWGPSWDINKYNLTQWETQNPDGWDTDFHTYVVEWTPNGFTFSVDNQTLGSVSPPEGGFWEKGAFASNLVNPWRYGSKMAPFDQKYHIIINLAVGGVSFFPDDALNNGAAKPWLNSAGNVTKAFWEAKDQWLPTWNLGTDQSALQVDYIRVTAV